MNVTVITTLHKDGYELYGKENLDTWTKFFPSSWNIHYYAEKHNAKLDQRVTVLDFDQTCPEWQDFYFEVKNRFSNDPKNSDSKRKNWYKKALRWSFKMFALMHSMKTKPSRYIVWLDADVLAKNNPPINWVESCLANTCLAGQLEFIKNGGHVETGILIIDLDHPESQKLYDWIEKGYIKKEILKESKAWDGIWMAKLVMSRAISWNNIKMVVKQNSARAFSNEKLSWLVHKVGKEKFNHSKFDKRSGRTGEQELI